MKVKLLKSVVVNSVSNTEATRRDEIVEVEDAEGRDLIKAGYAEESSGKVTAQAKQAPEPSNKMAPDTTTQAAAGATTAAGAARTSDAGTAAARRRGAGAAAGGKRAAAKR